MQLNSTTFSDDVIVILINKDGQDMISRDKQDLFISTTQFWGLLFNLNGIQKKYWPKRKVTSKRPHKIEIKIPALPISCNPKKLCLQKANISLSVIYLLLIHTL